MLFIKFLPQIIVFNYYSQTLTKVIRIFRYKICYIAYKSPDMKKYLLTLFVLFSSLFLFAQQGEKGVSSSDSLVAKMFSAQELKVYPNPVTEYFYFDYTTTFTKSAKLQVYNTLGKVLITVELTDKQGTEKVYVSDLEKGLYFCSLLVDDTRVVTKKIIINR